MFLVVALTLLVLRDNEDQMGTISPSDATPIEASSELKLTPRPTETSGAPYESRSPVSADLEAQGELTKSVTVVGVVSQEVGHPIGSVPISVRLLSEELEDDLLLRVVSNELGEFSAVVVPPKAIVGDEPAIILVEAMSPSSGYSACENRYSSLSEILGRTVVVSLRLRRTSVLKGTLSSTEGTPIAAAVLSLFRAHEYDADARASMVGGQTSASRRDGTFVIPVEEIGDFILLARAPELGATCVPVRIDTLGALVDLGLVSLSGPGRISGLAVGRHGGVIPRLDLLAMSSSPEMPDPSPVKANELRRPSWNCAGLAAANAVTDEYGKFSINGLADGAFVVHQTTDHRFGQPDGPFFSGGGQVLEFPVYPFVVQVVDEHGHFLPQANVIVEDGSASETSTLETRKLECITDDTGRAVVPWPRPGTVFVHVKRMERASPLIEFTVPSSGCLALPVLELAAEPAQSGGDLEVRVRSTPVIGNESVIIRVVDQSLDFIQEKECTIGGSGAEFSGLSIGEYLVTIVTDRPIIDQFVLSSTGLSRSVALQGGGTEYVEFDVVLGGRMRILIDAGGNPEVEMWTLWRKATNGTRERLRVVQKTKEGARISVWIRPGEWWTTEQVFAEGNCELEVWKGEELQATKVISVEPGKCTDWRIESMN